MDGMGFGMSEPDAVRDDAEGSEGERLAFVRFGEESDEGDRGSERTTVEEDGSVLMVAL